MTHSTAWLRWSVLGLVLVGASPAAAQGVKPADLVGTWQGVPGEDRELGGQGVGGRHTLVLRSDSIYEETLAAADTARNPPNSMERVLACVRGHALV
jgi:hypothetical protein